MSNPYPWNTEKSFPHRTTFWRRASRALLGPAILAAIIGGPIAWVGGAWATISWRRHNNLPRTYPLTLATFAAVAVAVSIVTGWGPAAWPGLYEDGKFPGLLALIWVTIWPIPLLIVALWAWAFNSYTEYNAWRYLEDRTPTWMQKRRAEKTRIAIAEHPSPVGALTPAVIVSDPLPWRQDRYGEPVRVDTTELGHGLVVGANGSGKTILGLTMVEQQTAQGVSSGFLDFKGSWKNCAKLRAIAAHYDAEFLEFDLAGDGDFYDPFPNITDSNQKRNLIMQMFSEDTTEEAFYRGAAEVWLELQFRTLEVVGLRDGEGTFRFLYETASVPGLIERLGDIEYSDPGIYGGLVEDARRMSDDRLQGLRDNLGKVVNTAVGNKLRRPRDGEGVEIDFARIAENPTIVWFGLTAGLDEKVARMIGALVVYDLTALSARRAESTGRRHPELFIMADEFSLLEEHISSVSSLLRTAREQRIWVWVLAQTLASFPETVLREVKNNTYWRIIFTLPDNESAAEMEGLTGKIKHVHRRSQVTARETLGGGRERSSTGEGHNELVDDPHIAEHHFIALPKQQAFMWSTDSSTDHLLTRKRRRRITGKDDCSFDIPIVKAVASTRVLDDHGISDDTPQVSLAAPPVPTLTGNQLNSIGQLRRRFPQAWPEVLTVTGVDPKTPLPQWTRAQASTAISTMIAALCRDIITRVGPDDYAHHYSRIVRMRHLPAVAAADIEGSWSNLNVREALMLADQTQAPDDDGAATNGTDTAEQTLPTRHKPAAGGRGRRYADVQVAWDNDEIPLPPEPDGDAVPADPVESAPVMTKAAEPAPETAADQAQPKPVGPSPAAVYRELNAQPERYGLAAGVVYGNGAAGTAKPTRAAWQSATAAVSNADRHS